MASTILATSATRLGTGIPKKRTCADIGDAGAAEPNQSVQTESCGGCGVYVGWSGLRNGQNSDEVQYKTPQHLL